MKRFKGLHPITWVLIAAAAIHAIGDVSEYWKAWTDEIGLYSSRGNLAPQTLRAAAITLQYFAYPAMVEFLVRIWDELRIQRWAILKLNGGPDAPPPDAGEA